MNRLTGGMTVRRCVICGAGQWRRYWWRTGRRAHAAVARGLLGAAEDPLREAKEVLGRPGPLSSNLRA